jgi:hypothetical protein
MADAPRKPPSKNPPPKKPPPLQGENAAILYGILVVGLALTAYFDSSILPYVIALWFALLSLSILTSVSRTIMYDIGMKGSDSHRRVLMGLATFVVTMAFAYLSYDANRLLGVLSTLWPR